MYTIQFNGVAATAQQDLFELTAAAARPVIVHALFLGQSTDYGDAAAEHLSVLLKRGQTTSGSGGSAGTAVALSSNGQAAGFACEVNNTTKASAGTIVTIHADVWVLGAGLVLVFTPEMRPIIGGGVRFTVELGTTPADSITINGTLYVEEL